MPGRSAVLRSPAPSTRASLPTLEGASLGAPPSRRQAKGAKGNRFLPCAAFRESAPRVRRPARTFVVAGTIVGARRLDTPSVGCALGRSAVSCSVRPSSGRFFLLPRPPRFPRGRRTTMAATGYILGVVAMTGGIAVLAGGSALAALLFEGRGRYGRGRYQHDRSVPDGDAGGDASATEGELLQGLRREDAAWCGLRLLCELAATAEASAERPARGAGPPQPHRSRGKARRGAPPSQRRPGGVPSSRRKRTPEGRLRRSLPVVSSGDDEGPQRWRRTQRSFAIPAFSLAPREERRKRKHECEHGSEHPAPPAHLSRPSFASRRCSGVKVEGLGSLQQKYECWRLRGSSAAVPPPQALPARAAAGFLFSRFVRDVGEEEDEETHNRLLEVVSEQDESGCGKRLVCELAAAEAEDERELLEEELAILEFVGDLVPGEDLRAQGAALDYKLAKAQGMEGRDCGLLYPSCIYNGTEIMTSVLAYLS
ncbi:hypothetical protein C7M84_019618 [Penaeus vannamei]|uniref:Uncharacterized protein n=1 Tax=Penaeus vannamei TaxID=6689 RepID=A0A3R7NNF1_PENVA|nr:hypothetical protein C7M84_019618 [Penaeus vannamei]